MILNLREKHGIGEGFMRAEVGFIKMRDIIWRNRIDQGFLFCYT